MTFLIEKKLRNLVVSGYGSKLKKKGEMIAVELDDEEKEFSPRYLEQVIFFGECNVTGAAIRYLKKEDVDVVFVDEEHDQYLRVIEANENPINDVWLSQMRIPEKESMGLAKEMIAASIYNKIRLLEQFDVSDEKLEDRKKSVVEADSKDRLRGIEGEASRIYFSNFEKILPEGYDFEGRHKNPPPDPVNSMLSYGYTVLNSRIHYSLLRAKLNPYIGVFHESYRDKAALTYDFIEPFRPVIVDRTVLTMLNRDILESDDFEQIDPNTCYLQGEGKQAFLNKLFGRMESEIKYEGDKREFLDVMFLQAEDLANHIQGKGNFKAYRWR